MSSVEVCGGIEDPTTGVNMTEQSVLKVSCPVCGGTDIHRDAVYRGRSRQFKDLLLLQCDACELVFAYPLPTESELATYNRSYFQHAHGGSPTESALLFFAGMAHLRVQHVRAFLTSRQLSPVSVLEIGPGPGLFCERYLEQDPKPLYVAVEPDLAMHERLRELGARAYTRLQEIPESEMGFDLLIMSHVLEHSSTPVSFLRDVLRFVNPGGTAFIEVPCRDHEFKRINEPHLLFFDKPAMRELLGKVNLTDIELTYHGQDLRQLRRESYVWHRLLRRLRNAIPALDSPIAVSPPRGGPALEAIPDPALQDAVRGHEAHLTKECPSWWLRALARKPPK